MGQTGREGFIIGLGIMTVQLVKNFFGWWDGSNDLSTEGCNIMCEEKMGCTVCKENSHGSGERPGLGLVWASGLTYLRRAGLGSDTFGLCWA